jgi:hypothetical protein
MQNIKQLREMLSENFERLKENKLDKGKAKELTSIAGKIISTATTELKYQQHLGVKKPIDFLEYND